MHGKRSVGMTVSGVCRVAGIVLAMAALGCRDRPAAPPDTGPAGARPAPQQRQSSQTAVAGLESAIRAAVNDGRETVTVLRTPAEHEVLVALYEAGHYAPLWVDASGRPNHDAIDGLALLDNALSEGLDPADYHARALAASSSTLAASAPAPLADIAAFETGLSASVLRYLRHLHAGRVDPRTIGFRMTTPADDHDYVEALRSAVASRRLDDAVAELTPPLVLYRNLRDKLGQYRALAAEATPEPSFQMDDVLEPGQPYADAATLRHRLVTLGDLPGDAPAPADPARYDDGLVDAVKRFQARHGLATDGVLGRKTQAALSVPLASRVRQIELALERLRWLPHLGQERFVAVNIPMFRLWGWDTIPRDGAPAFSMEVIVGRALDTQTPVFVERREHVIFRPYWNVPTSIVRSELLPALRRDPSYFRRQNFEAVAGQGDDSPVVPLTADTLAALERGRVRVRQRPGPANALGLVKFIFPNDENVYLHDTPAHQLFSQSRRDFSHGCVRVEDPVGLAEWALRGQEGWTRERIVGAMQGARTLQVNLARPIQVILFYVTAAVMPEDGSIHFAEDIYQHDARLDRALTQRPSG